MNTLDDAVVITGPQPGPTSLIIGGVHGDETCGSQAVLAAMHDVQVQKGRVLLLFGNPRAIRKNCRFTETNLNRMFRPDSELSQAERASYEYGRAQQLKPYFAEASALLDIHASFTPGSLPFIICEPQSYAVASQLPASIVVSGFDRVQPGGTDYYMNRLGKIGICLESGYLGDPASRKIAQDGITSFLRARGHIDGMPISGSKQTRLSVFLQYRTQTSSFKLARAFNDFAVVRQGEQIGHDGPRSIVAPKTCRIIFARDHSAIGEEAFLLAE
ncbi:MAG: succinylglutamate desuccinylase/aspartoacylase family protein [bacterium]|nr:succinylglutamate desuccinylase/aspartoacylase family protein [bacterium]